jgi:structural maintenance of chromosome 4
MAPISTPENVPRLFDLINAKEAKYRAAFYQGLNNTLVALDLTQANRIAYGKTRYRVVTIDGSLIDNSGTMSGGGNRVQRGGMSSKFETITPKQMEKLVNDFEMAEENYAKAKKQLSDLLNEKCTSEIPLIELEVSKLCLNLESIEKEIQDYKSHIENLEK